MSLPQLLEITNLIAAAATIVIGALVIREMARLRLGFPQLGTILVAFFFTLALDRAAAPDPLLSYSVELDAVTDLLLIALLGALLFRARGLAQGLIATVDEARLRAEEYERARYDYSQLVQHRLANPLTAVYGAAETLQRTDIDEATRKHLLATILEGAQRIEELGLGPERQGAEERELDATPKPAIRRDPLR